MYRDTRRLIPRLGIPLMLGLLFQMQLLVPPPAGAQENLQNVRDKTGEAVARPRPRVVVMSDFPPLDVIIGPGPANKRSDPDDIQSMVRFLLYTNEFDVQGLVASSATFANIANKQNVLDILNLYDKVDENLRKHDPRYPTADRLRTVTWQGASGTYGRAAKDGLGASGDSEASERIIALLENPDSRPVYFAVWGGPYDLAQALWKIKANRSGQEAERLLAKVRVYLIGLQDSSAQWLLDNFPKLHVVAARTTWQGIYSSKDLDWINAHVRSGHGALGAAYPSVAMGTKPGVKEGDSPSFLYLVSAVRGLNDPERPGEPSWGGQFVRADPDGYHWIDEPSSPRETVRRWSAAFDNDFAARMDWCVQDFSHANHPPIVVVDGGFQHDVTPGQTVRLKATASDPDGDELRYKWSQDAEVELSSAAVVIARTDSRDQASFVVPNEPGKRVYVILEVTDSGTPPLAGYQRIIFNIKSGA